MSRSHPAQPRLRTVFAFRLSSLGGSEPWVAVKHEAIDPPSAIGATEAAGGSSRPARLGLILGGRYQGSSVPVLLCAPWRRFRCCRSDDRSPTAGGVCNVPALNELSQNRYRLHRSRLCSSQAQHVIPARIGDVFLASTIDPKHVIVDHVSELVRMEDSNPQPSDPCETRCTVTNLDSYRLRLAPCATLSNYGSGTVLAFAPRSRIISPRRSRWIGRSGPGDRKRHLLSRPQNPLPVTTTYPCASVLVRHVRTD